jgi:hypothetical protein
MVFESWSRVMPMHFSLYADGPSDRVGPTVIQISVINFKFIIIVGVSVEK